MLIDIFNENSKLNLQVAYNKEEFWAPFQNFFKRTKVEFIKVLCQFIPSGSSRYKATKVEWENMPTAFKRFVESLGEVRKNEDGKIVAHYKDVRTDVEFFIGATIEHKINIIWDNDGQAMNSANAQWNQNKTEIEVAPLQNGYFRVRVRVKEKFAGGPLSAKQIVSKRNLAHLIRQTVINVSRTITKVTNV